MADEGADDEDGSPGPPPSEMVGGGGIRTSPLRLGPGSVPVKLWSSDEDTQSGAGFLCVHDITRNVFYAKMVSTEGHEDDDGEATKAAITTLLDVAEAFNSRKITLGLGSEHAGCTDLVCSLLYLGFQVVPSQKSPLTNTVLLFDFDLGPPSAGGHMFSDHTCTGTSECSTSAEDEGAFDSSGGLDDTD